MPPVLELVAGMARAASRAFSVPVLLLLAAGLAACSDGGGGGGGSGAAPAITTNPQSVAVQEGETAAFTVVATGSGTLSYQWRKDGADIAGATNPSYTTPPTTLADDGASFTVVSSNSLGSATSAPAILTVNSPARSWRSSQALRPQGPESSSLGSAVSASGGASQHAAAWIDVNQNTFVSEVRARRYTLAGGWSAPVTVLQSNGSLTEPEYPSIAMDSSGRITLVFAARDTATGKRTILAASSDSGTTWSSLERLESDVYDSTLPVVAVDGFGMVTVVWLRGANLSAGQQRMAVARRGPPQPWGSATTISVDVPAGGGTRPRLAAVNGRVVAAWTGSGSFGQFVASNFYDGSQWFADATPVTPDSPAKSDAVYGVALNSAGEVALSFERLQSGVRSVHLARRAAGVWTVEPVDAFASGSTKPVVAIAEDNSIAMAWQRDIPFDPTLFGALRTPAGAWSSPTALLRRPDSQAIRFDSAGNLVLVAAGAPNGGADEIRSVQRASGGSWSVDESIEALPAVTSVSVPDAFSMATDGTAVSVWIEFLSATNCVPWANTYR